MLGRWLAILIGTLVLVGGAVAHGLWTDRWQQSSDLAEAVERLAGLPDDLGLWKGFDIKQDPEALALTGAVGHYSRSFLDPKTGERVLVILLVGKPARMSVHRPEHCYTAAGYTTNEPPVQAQVSGEGFETAELFTALFSREESSGLTQLRIFWSFSSGDRWEAPNSPRTRFARKRLLYKLYVIRHVLGTPGPLADDAGTRLLEQLLPVLKKTVTAGL